MILSVVCVTGLGACGDRPQDTPRVEMPGVHPLASAREAVVRGDHQHAAATLREALPSLANSLEAHYLLGVSASHLDQIEEAEREFQWVVTHGDLAAPEVPIARDWLASRPGDMRKASSSPGGSASDDGPEQEPALASLSGTATDAKGPKARLLLFLKGRPGSNSEGKHYSLRTDQAGHFHFPNVVPGDYLLTDAVAGPVNWRLKVAASAGERLTLALTPSNSAGARDDFTE